MCDSVSLGCLSEPSVSQVFTEIMTAMGEQLDQAQVAKMISMCDVSGNGKGRKRDVGRIEDVCRGVRGLTYSFSHISSRAFDDRSHAPMV